MPRGRPKHADILTPREWQVLDLLREGLTNDQIAARLAISESGARYHVSEILSKLGVASREEAAAWHERARRARILAALPHLRIAAPARAVAVAGVMAAGIVLLTFAVFRGNTHEAVVAGPLGKIAYVRDGDIWVMAMPHGKPQRLTDDRTDAHPKWSASGEWLTYIRTGPQPQFGLPAFETWVMRGDGSGRRRLDTTYPGGAGWSPVADQLLYLSSRGSLVVEDADGSHQHEVAGPYTSPTEAGGLAAGFAWSPDGESVAYGFQRWPAPGTSPAPTPPALTSTPGPSSTPFPYPTPPGPERTYAGIWRVAADGSNPRELVRFDDPRTRALLAASSPGGASLLFGILPPLPVASQSPGEPAGLGAIAVYAVSFDGGTPRLVGHASNFAIPLSPSPGRERAALSSGEAAASWTDKGIFVLDFASGLLTRLTGPDVAAISPAWSPDGAAIVYTAAADPGPLPPGADVATRRTVQDRAVGSRRIWTMAPDGSNKRQLTGDSEYRDEDPQWSEDGSHILFARLAPEPCATTYSLWLLRLQDGVLEEVASGLPLFGSHELLQVGDIPRCMSESTFAFTTESFGYMSFGAVFDWWSGP